MRKPTTGFFGRARARDIQARDIKARHTPAHYIPASHPVVPLALSFCSGFVDVTCFLGLFHSFTAFITGTVVILCAELFESDSLLWMRVVILATFLVSAVAWIGIVRRLVSAGWPMLRIGLALESLFLLAFAASAIALPVDPHFLAAGTTFALVFATIAMSLQNVIMQLVLNYHVPTTVMTGNFMRFLITTIEKREGAGRESTGKAAGGSAPTSHYGWSLLSFVFGGALGALCLSRIDFWGLLLPAGLLALMATFSRDQ